MTLRLGPASPSTAVEYAWYSTGFGRRSLPEPCRRVEHGVAASGNDACPLSWDASAIPTVRRVEERRGCDWQGDEHFFLGGDSFEQIRIGVFIFLLLHSDIL